jgi:hypothetical protein
VLVSAVFPSWEKPAQHTHKDIVAAWLRRTSPAAAAKTKKA